MFRVIYHMEVVTFCPVQEEFPIFVGRVVAPDGMVAVEVPHIYSRVWQDWEDSSVPFLIWGLVDIGNVYVSKAHNIAMGCRLDTYGVSYIASDICGTTMLCMQVVTNQVETRYSKSVRYVVLHMCFL